MARHVERRTHTKSRKGCLQCKKRHVKCNETRPQCARCERLDIECSWPLKKQVESVKEDSTDGQLPCINSLELSSLSPERAADRLDVRDLKLLQFWFLNTSLTCSQVGRHYVWQTSIVDLGFRHHFLLRGILATAAIHRATVHPEETDELLFQSFQHMDIAMAAFRQHLSKPDPATCIPVFALACLLNIHRLGLAQVQPPVDPVEEFCLHARLSRGIKPTVNEYWERILSSEMGPVVRDARLMTSPGQESMGSFLDALLLKDVVYDHHLDTALQDDCLAAIDTLHTLFTTTPIEADQAAIGRLFSWMANLSNGFLEMLERKQMVALVILAHFAVLMGRGERVWYLRGWAGWLLGAVEREVGEELGEWLEWPRGEIWGRVEGGGGCGYGMEM